MISSFYPHQKSAHQKKIEKALLNIQSNPPAFLDVYQNSFFDICKKEYQNFKHSKHLLVLGIGGSALGTNSILQALNRTSKITIIDNIDPEELEKTLHNINFSETCINVISKSGNTLETMLQMSVVEKIIQQKHSSILHKNIIYTTEENSPLFEYAKKNNSATLPISKKIGGRFSVFTPVGIFPLLFAEVHIEELLKGAEFVSNNVKSHTNLDDLIHLSILQYNAYKEEHRNMTILMSYHKKLIGLLDWYRQLLAESIGKNKNTGITPVLAFGSTDQHSQIQLYTEGPQDKLILFLSTKTPSNNDQQYNVLGMKNPLNVAQVQNALFEGTKKSLEKHKCPYAELFLKDINEYEIGKFLMTMMVHTSILGEILEINPYDQPGVEEGKIQTKKILNNT
jgi:glucose-6-phosphate isomerase